MLSFNQATSIGNSDRSRLGIQNMAAKDPVIVPAFFTLLISFLCRAALSAKSPSYYYDQCAPSNCGDSVLQFPFGLNPLCRTAIVSSSCENGSVYLTQVGAQGKYRILDDLTSPVYDRGVFTLVDVSLLGCGPIAWSADNTDGLRWFMAGNLLVSSDYKTGTFFNCTHPPEADMMARLSKAPCLECGNSTHNNNLCYYYDGYMDKISNCTAISVALQKDLVNNFTRAGNLRTKLQEGFKIQWKSSCGTACMNASGGRCGFVDDERGEGSEMCFCASSVHKTSCSDGIIISLGGGKSQKKSLIAGLGAGFAFLMVGIICLAYGWKRNQSKKKKLELIRGQDEAALRRYLEDKKAPASIETFLENYACGVPTRFSYKQIKKYSNNFSEKLGQGGFGSVFKAVLPNGCLVAVKLLDETKQSETQFLNEVGTVGQIHHNNLVRLLGFCVQQSKRALVYEFMENGSLEKYIHGRRKNPETSVPSERLISWSQLLNIALGTARGVAYLHEECRIRILHCDIKPHNILLDEKFQAKVSDFGLAQLVNKEHSHVTLSGGRGTPGYAPPEMWWKKYGPITEKSDVYSFGMVVLEMVGGRRNFVSDASKPSEMYFPEWVYKHHVLLQNGCEGTNTSSSSTIAAAGSKWHVCDGEEDEKIARMLELVGLWCIQSSPTKRPSMRKVVHMLEGTAVIELPPIPFDASVAQFARSDN